MLYQKKPQLDGTKAHETIDCGRYCSGKNVLTGLDVYSAKYGLIGKIDIYDRNKAKLIERKKRIKTIYDGYILQPVSYTQLCDKHLLYPSRVKKASISSYSGRERSSSFAKTITSGNLRNIFWITVRFDT